MTDNIDNEDRFDEDRSEAALRARAQCLIPATIDGTDLLTVEVSGQDRDIIINPEDAEYLRAKMVDLDNREPLDAMTRGEARITQESPTGLSINVEWTISFTASSRKAAAQVIADTEAKLVALTGSSHVPAVWKLA